MRIEYKGEIVDVEYINDDPTDEDMPLLVRFPEGHLMRDDSENEGTVWIRAKDFRILEGLEEAMDEG